MRKKSAAEEGLDVQLEFILKEYRRGEISITEFMKFTEMIYRDFLDFHPEERDRIIGEDVEHGSK
jgi:hypothetical protein